MGKLKASENPELNLEMTAIDAVTEVHYSQMNPRYQQILDNDAALHQQIEDSKTTVDSEISDTSENPVQNKVIAARFAAQGAPVLIQEDAPSDTSALWVW
jgi:hypothetical protein